MSGGLWVKLRCCNKIRQQTRNSGFAGAQQWATAPHTKRTHDVGEVYKKAKKDVVRLPSQCRALVLRTFAAALVSSSGALSSPILRLKQSFFVLPLFQGLAAAGARRRHSSPISSCLSHITPPLLVALRLFAFVSSPITYGGASFPISLCPRSLSLIIPSSSSSAAYCSLGQSRAMWPSWLHL